MTGTQPRLFAYKTTEAVDARFEVQPWAWGDELAAVPVRTDVDGGDDTGRHSKIARVGE